MPKTDREMRGATLYAKLIQQLMLVGGTYNELMEFTGLSYHTVIRYVQALRDCRDSEGRRLVRIADWDENAVGVRTLAVYRLEPGPDVKRPRLTAAERKRRERKKTAGAALQSAITKSWQKTESVPD